MPLVSAADTGNDFVVQQPFCFALGDMTELAKLLQTDKPVDKYEPIVFFSVMEAPPSKSSAMAGGCVSRFFSPFSPLCLPHGQKKRDFWPSTREILWVLIFSGFTKRDSIKLCEINGSLDSSIRLEMR